ncbi:sensor histidine kinase [Metabacillus litoralis]|uniref:sensor histidine kinase n=1 Tax=Metabacillus litoralis TaxID=152268 RepID=UPI000EF60045|nr:sensor histidine kinase [Metabacillus litoralis]MCM3160758.1 sensor histidine kinase [Metabacillus litoralis]MCM3411828.1 sensor histidine kinase [Metabacillus litoralis]
MLNLNIWFKNLKFRNKILFICLLASLLPVITLGSFWYNQIQHLFITRENEVLDESLNQAISSVNYKVNTYFDVINHIVWNEDVKRGVTSHYDNNYEMFLFYHDTLDPLLNTSKFLQTDINRITIYSNNKMHSHGESLRPLSDIETYSWFNSISKATTPRLIVSAKEETFEVASQLFDRHHNTTNIVYMDINYGNVFESMSTLYENNYGLIILDENDMPVYQINKFSKKNMSYALTESELLNGLMEDSLKEQYIYKKAELMPYNWKAYLYRPIGTVSASSYELELTFFIVVLSSILILFFSIYFLSKVVVRPLIMLSKNMEQIEKGELIVTVTNTASDEIGNLIQKFGDMVHKLQTMINEVYKSKIARQEYEMKALQAQINPHFFYNSLSLINSKAIMADQEDISQMAQYLSSFYRTTLNQGKSIISVKDELENTTSYIQIQRMMHSDSFEVYCDVDNKILNYTMINLLLQPLVENAINHGIDHKETPGKGILTLSGKQNGDNLIFTVTDNGCGIDPEKLRTILTNKTKGYGVRNVHHRVQLSYGREFGLAYQSELNLGTTVTLTIPKRHTT